MNIFFFKWIKEKWNIRTLHGQWLGFSSNKQVNYKAKKLALQLLKWYRYAGKKKSTKVTHFILICCHQSIKLKSLKNMHIHPNSNEEQKIQWTIKYLPEQACIQLGWKFASVKTKPNCFYQPHCLQTFHHHCPQFQPQFPWSINHMHLKYTNCKTIKHKAITWQTKKMNYFNKINSNPVNINWNWYHQHLKPSKIKTFRQRNHAPEA